MSGLQAWGGLKTGPSQIACHPAKTRYYRGAKGDFDEAVRLVAVLVGGLLGLAASASAAEGPGLALDVLQPAYRDSIYATQKEQLVSVRVGLPESLRAQVVEVRGRLLDPQGRELAVTKPGLKATEEVRFESLALPAGTYSVAVRAVGAAGQELAAAQTVIHKRPPAPGSEVRIDAQRNIVVDGKPEVQIGWYGAVRLDDPRPEVLTLQNIQTAVVVNFPDKSPVAKLFREHGIRTLVNLEPGRLLYAFDLWKQPGHPVPTEHTRLAAPSAECRELLRKMVELLKDEPGLFGWYIADEPEINNYRADYLEAYYRTLRELDPYHPVVVTNDTLEGLEKFGYRCCDILGPDPYGEKPNYVPSFLERANRVLRRGQGLMLTPWHSAQHTHFTVDYGTAPPYSYRVMRGQYLATLAAGGRGFTGYASDFFLPEPRLRIGLPHLWREVRFLEPFLASGDPTPLSVSSVAVSNVTARPAPPSAPRSKESGSAVAKSGDESPDSKEILAWIGKCDGQLALIVMNSGLQRRRVTLRHPALTMSKIAVLSEAREVTLQGSTLTDDIPSGEACVYSTAPRGPTLPTVAQVEAEIAAFERAAAKPGNLLHASRGVKARASKGTIPWFGQIYYYAINGVTDDEGWHVTHAELPQWIEFALTSPQPIGRVVLHTPNLRDYDLQFRGADGSIQQAAVRGNTAEVAEHVLAAPVATLKLRLIARAVRENARIPRAMVREVEAYGVEPAPQPAGAPEAGQTGKPGPRLQLTRIEASAEPPVDPVAAAPQTPPLWRDDFSAFKHKPQHYQGDPEAWVLNPADFTATYDPQGRRLLCTATSPAGYASMGRLLPYSREQRFFQVSVPQIMGEGYQWLNVSFGDPSGKATSRPAVHTIKPGRYTVDTHALHDIFRAPEQRQVLLNFYVMKGIEYAFTEMRLAAQPVDGLAITMADGSPVPRTLKTGDELRLRVFLEQPATDVVVELLRDSWYEAVRINGEPYVQLLKSGQEKDGRQWAAVVKLGPQTDKFKVKGYPVLFRAAISGGAIKETLSTILVDFE